MAARVLLDGTIEVINPIKPSKDLLTFEQLCPKWAKIVHSAPITEKNGFIVDHKRLNITECRNCIVGEANGFSEKYNSPVDFGCPTCSNHSIRFATILHKTPQVRSSWINSFMNHWNKSHG